MIVKVIPIRAYDFDMFKTFARDQYGIDILPACFDVDIHDYENPRCGNCDRIVRGAYENRCIRPRYCISCGAEMKWPIDYIGAERDK